MAVAGTISVTGTLTGHPEGSRTVALEWDITAGLSAVTVGLASGANTITVPTGCTLVIIVPPTTNTETITLKGVTGDTGRQISKTKPTILAWETGSDFFLLTSGAIAGAEIYFV